LDRYVLGRLPSAEKGLVVGPSVGEDSAILDLDRSGKRYLVVSSDPISGAEEEIGRYVVHVNANDVATAGARPSFFLCNIMMAMGSTTEDLDRLFSQISEECRGLGVTIVGGHTEASPIERTMVSGTMFGFVDGEHLARRPAERGDVVIITKGAGIEGTSIIARKRGGELSSALGADLVRRARSYSSRISVVPDAMILAEHRPKRMHDPTEGGVLGGLVELSVASQISIKVNADSIPISAEARAICEFLSVDPLRLIGSGSLLCVLPPSESGRAMKRLDHEGIPAAEIGYVESVGQPKLTLIKGEEEETVSGFPEDELWRIVI